MPVLLLTDIHGVYPALEAILNTPEARRCDRIISLGDQVNFGPESRRVFDTLRSLDATMLLGNHEERLMHPEDFVGYNWGMLRLTQQQMAGVSFQSLPVDLRMGKTLLTHGTPGNPYHLVYEKELPEVLSQLPEGVDTLISGHNHLRWDVRDGQKRAFNPGSAGLNETGVGHTAMFAIWDGDSLTQCSASYNPDDVIRAYIQQGFAEEAPEIARSCIQVMQTGEYQGVLKLMRHVSATAASLGMDFGDRDAWLAADRTYPWNEKMSTADYWAVMKERFV